MKVVGTAGHIDHGKSALVYRLTGIDPDRLEEEKRRGMTIDLGFAWLRLPDGQTVSIVDVPGHERFVANMLAGVGGIDVALLVVAADESIMPQTREHVDILDLLGIGFGVVALTKTDLADPDLIELASAEVADLLSRTALAGSPIVPVSAVTGEGLPDLLTALNDAVTSATDRDERGPAYLPVDRVFTVAGFGTVVTGTLHDGTLAAGDEVEVLPSGRRARIRSLQTHSTPVDRALPGTRVAANLVGVERNEVGRGDVLTPPGAIVPTRRFDAHVRVVRDAPFALKHGQEVRLHLGAGEYPATVSVLGANRVEPGDTGWLQIRSSTPLPAILRQRFILRLPAPARTIAGGGVVDIRPRHRRNDAGAVQRLAALLSDDPERVMEAALQTSRVLTPGQIAEIAALPEAMLREALGRAVDNGTAVPVGDGYAGARSWARMSERARSILERFHTDNPLRRGITREELRSKLHRDRAEWDSWLSALLVRGVVEDSGSLIALPGFVDAGESRREEAERVLAALSAREFTPPSGRDLQDFARTDAELLSFLAENGEIVHVGSGIYFTAAAFDKMLTLALSIIDREGDVSMGRFRDAAGTSRKYAQAFLEYLDARRITRRVGDVRVRGREAPACA